MLHVKTNSQIADLLTKALSAQQFSFLVSKLNMVNLYALLPLERGRGEGGRGVKIVRRRIERYIRFMIESKIKGRRKLPSLPKRQGPIVDVSNLFYTIRHVIVVFGLLYISLIISV